MQYRPIHLPMLWAQKHRVIALVFVGACFSTSHKLTAQPLKPVQTPLPQHDAIDVPAEAAAAKALAQACEVAKNDILNRKFQTEHSLQELAFAQARLGHVDNALKSVETWALLGGSPTLPMFAETRQDVYRLAARRRAFLGDIAGAKELLLKITNVQCRCDVMLGLSRAYLRRKEVQLALDWAKQADEVLKAELKKAQQSKKEFDFDPYYHSEQHIKIIYQVCADPNFAGYEVPSLRPLRPVSDIPLNSLDFKAQYTKRLTSPRRKSRELDANQKLELLLEVSQMITPERLPVPLETISSSPERQKARTTPEPRAFMASEITALLPLRPRMERTFIALTQLLQWQYDADEIASARQTVEHMEALLTPGLYPFGWNLENGEYAGSHYPLTVAANWRTIGDKKRASAIIKHNNSFYLQAKSGEFMSLKTAGLEMFGFVDEAAQLYSSLVQPDFSLLLHKPKGFVAPPQWQMIVGLAAGHLRADRGPEVPLWLTANREKQNSDLALFYYVQGLTDGIFDAPDEPHLKLSATGSRFAVQ